ncbi:hypothetical protein L873DRAFT_1808924 [Choiromyces venosus 120613-1]|uniref:Uncharacterized protein n=1 Tax=Choiromyces venosus 120613-1 TaxID=1336337 RepID=A0A3N4JIJ6_9PEZI|nr:hypothetical protein L873DRAFT_1808924 [Choiromyces venosus 120613-1]
MNHTLSPTPLSYPFYSSLSPYPHSHHPHHIMLTIKPAPLLPPTARQSSSNREIER